MKHHFNAIAIVLIAALFISVIAGCAKQQPTLRPVQGADVDIDGSSATVAGEELDVSGLDTNDDDLGFDELDTLEDDLGAVG